MNILSRFKRSSDKKVVFIHIGMMKTGTSAIQNFLSRNNNYLNKNGYFIPNSSSAVGNYFAFSILDETPPFIHSKYNIGAEKLYDTVCNEINSVTYDKIILSSEALFLISSDLFLGEEAVKRFYNLISKNNYEFKVIVYLRRQDHFIESWYNQTIKTHNFWNLYSNEIEDFIKDKSDLLDYDKILNYWGSYFGKENIIVKDYDTCKMDINNSFLQCLDSNLLNEENIVADNTIKNKSLSTFGLKIMKELNKLNINKSNAKINADLVKAIELLEKSKHLNPRKFRISSNKRITLLNKFKECNDKLSLKYGINTSSWYRNEPPYTVTDNTSYNETDLLELISIIWNNINENQPTNV